MLDGASAIPGYMTFASDSSSRQKFSLTAPASALLVASALAAAWMAHVRLTAPDFAALLSPPQERAAPANPFGTLGNPQFASASSAVALDARLAFTQPVAHSPAPAPKPAANPFGRLVDPGFVSATVEITPPPKPVVVARLEPAAPPPPVLLPVARPAPIAAATPLAEAPLPPARPANLTPAPAVSATTAPPVEAAPPEKARISDRRVASRGKAAAPIADNRNFFQKLFGISASQTSPGASSPVVAASYASAEPPPAIANFGGLASRYDRFTAVYDLSAHVVYMPDGRRLEAHSGLGEMIDDPRHVNERMRGATPPAVYALQPREASFHGVAALRLNPIGGGELFGRAGLLAHPYMMGPNGDSNGCVSFKDYDAFRQAFDAGQVKRLAVVARLD